MVPLTIQSIAETSWLSTMATHTLAGLQRMQAICVRPPMQPPLYGYQQDQAPLLIIPWGINQDKGKRALYMQIHLQGKEARIIDIPHGPAMAAIDLNTLGGWSSAVMPTHLIAVCPAWGFQLAVSGLTGLLLPTCSPEPDTELAHLHLELLQRAFSETYIETDISLFCRYLRQALIPIIQTAQQALSEALKGVN